MSKKKQNQDDADERPATPRGMDRERLLNQALRGTANISPPKMSLREALKHNDTLFALEAELFPQSYGSLATDAPRTYSESFVSEFEFLNSQLLKYSNRINRALIEKSTFENCLLRGDWVNASRAIGNSISVVGHTLWSAEARLLVEEHEGGLEALRLLSRDLMGELKQHSWILYWITQKVERGISQVSYDGNVSSIIKSVGNERSQELVAYFRFRADFHRLVKATHLAAILWFESKLPLFDQYLTLIRILQCLAGDATK